MVEKYNFKKFANRWYNANLGRIKDEELEFINSTKYIDEVEKKGEDYQNISTKSSHLWISNLDALVSSVLGWIHCNPSIPDTVELTKETFVWPSTNKNHTNILNTRNGIDSLFSYLTDNEPNKRIVAIVGSKGQGKTYTQNYFLNTKSRDLADKNFVWFRIDLTKILKYRENFREKISLAEYLYAHVVYVFFRYCSPIGDREADPLFSKIDLVKLREDARIACSKEITKEDFEKYYSEVESDCRVVYPRNNGLHKPFKSPIVKSLSRTIIKSLKKQGILYLLFFDGIDNVDYAFDKNLSEWIQEILHGDIDKNIPPDLRILTCRIETYHFIKRQKIFNVQAGQNTSFSPKKFTLASLQPSDIFKKTIKSLADGNLYNKPSLRLQLEKYKKSYDFKLAGHTPNEKIRDYYSFGINYTKYLTQYLIDNGIDKEMKPNKILSVLYNDSLRDMLFDIKHVYMYIHMYMLEENKRNSQNSEINERPNLMVSKYIHRRNLHLIIDAIARRGKVYCNDVSTFAPPFMLLHSLNIIMPFDFGNLTGYSGKDLLLGYIVLRYVSDNPCCSKHDISSYCQKFHYKEDKIEKFDRKLLEHGLIEIYKTTSPEKTTSSKEKNHWLPRMITERGKFLLKEALLNPNLLHAYSYEIYFPNIFIKNGILKAHKNNFEEFSSAQITNVLSLQKLLQLHQLRNNLPNFVFFNDRIINLLERYYLKLPEKKKKELIDKFDGFMQKYNS